MYYEKVSWVQMQQPQVRKIVSLVTILIDHHTRSLTNQGYREVSLPDTSIVVPKGFLHHG